MKLDYTDMPIEEKKMDDHNRLLNIMRLEKRLFDAIEIEQNMPPCEALDSFRRKVSSMAIEYSRISI